MRGGATRFSKRPQKPIPDEGPYRSFVGNLPNDTIQGDFDQLFNGLTIKSIHMMRDRETDAFKGFAYVEFGSKSDLEKALALDGVDFDGRFIRVDVADERRDKREKFGRGGGRGGGTAPRGGFGNESRGSLNNDGFRTVTRGGRSGGAGGFARSDREHGENGQGARGAGGAPNFGFNYGRNNNNRGGAGRRDEPRAAMSDEPDPNRPRLNLKPRTTDPEELARKKAREEEERKQRLEKICTAR